jgi:Ca2+-binding RTX toxin-like protein
MPLTTGNAFLDASARRLTITRVLHAGDDTMTGGAGNDRFDDDGWGEDAITDLRPGTDKLHLVDVEALDLFSPLIRTTEAAGARVSVAGASILLRGLTAAQVTAADVILS